MMSGKNSLFCLMYVHPRYSTNVQDPEGYKLTLFLLFHFSDFCTKITHLWLLADLLDILMVRKLIELWSFPSENVRKNTWTCFIGEKVNISYLWRFSLCYRSFIYSSFSQNKYNIVISMITRTSVLNTCRSGCLLSARVGC